MYSPFDYRKQSPAEIDKIDGLPDRGSMAALFYLRNSMMIEDEVTAKQLAVMTNGQPEHQLLAHNQPNPPDWQEICAVMMNREIWQFNEAINMVCSLRPDRVCYANWEGREFHDAEEAFFATQDDPRSWVMDATEKRYAEVRKIITTAINIGELAVHSQHDNHNIETTQLRRPDFLAWASSKIPNLADELKLSANKPKRPATVKQHTTRRQANLGALVSLIASDPTGYMKPDGTLNISLCHTAISEKRDQLFDKPAHLLEERSFRKLCNLYIRRLD